MFTLFSNSEESADPDDEEEAEFEPATNWGSMFQSPVREEPENEEPPEMEQAAPESEGFSAPPEGFDEPAPEEKEDGSDVPRGFEMPETEFAPPEDSDSPSSEVKVDEPVESAGFEMPESEPVSEPVKDEAPAKVEAEEPEEEPEPAPAAKSEPAQAEPVKEKEVEKPNPTLEWTTTPAAPATPRANEEPVVSRLQNNDEDDLSDVELRAIFSTSDRFTLAKLARKIVALPGIAACALSGSGKVVQATKSEQNQLGSDAHDMVDAVRNIAKLTGMDSAKSFTMKTEFGVVSLFLEDDCCLSVNHEEGEFGPGVREKLIVIARSMHKLKD